MSTQNLADIIRSMQGTSTYNSDPINGMSVSTSPDQNLQALMDRYNNNGQGTQLNNTQQTQQQPQQKYQLKDSTGQPINAMIDTSYLDPNNPQYHQIMAHNAAINNQQKQAQQQQNPQQSQQSQLQQYLQQQQLELLAEQKRQYEDAQSQANTQVLSSFGENPIEYAARVKEAQNPDAAKQAQQQYQQTLTGLMTGVTAQQAGGASAQQELALQALKNQGANQVASTQFGQSDLEHIGKYYINPKTDAVFNEDGTPASLADSVMAQQAKNQNAKTNKWTDTGVKVMSAPANGLDALDLLSKTLNTYKSSTNQDNNIPLSQVLAKGSQYLTENGISGNPDMSKLINTAHMTSMALAPLLTDRQSLGMLKQINDVIGRPGMYPLSTLQNDIDNLNTLAKNKYKNNISQYKNANYDTSNFEKDYNNRFNNQTPDTDTTPQGTQPEGTIRTNNKTGEKHILRGGQWQPM